MREGYFKPTKKDLIHAVNKTVPDVIADDLKILFCGINPGLYTAAVGHHFARPGNRFWPALYKAGFTPHLFSAFEDNNLIQLGYGITNLVSRATNTANEVAENEFIQGATLLKDKIKRYQPKWVAFVGIGAYKAAFHKKTATIGRQRELLNNANIWLLPSTSGINANYKPHEFIQIFSELFKTVNTV